ncbi:MAG: hypothetical protein JSS20_05680 [Proteobacteria bacterium]|nr:hypothetical protein [Pseudomonadota bacterium]
MQEIVDAIRKASEMLGNPNATRRDKSAAIALLETAYRRLDVLIATLKAQQRG